MTRTATDTKTTAGERTIPLAGRLRAELARHKLATGRDADGLCFGRTPTSAFVRSTLRSRALAAWKAAGLEPLSPHEARHTCASYPAAAGLTPKEAQTAMGHSDIRTTLNVYAKAVLSKPSHLRGLCRCRGVLGGIGGDTVGESDPQRPGAGQPSDARVTYAGAACGLPSRSRHRCQQRQRRRSAHSASAHRREADAHRGKVQLLRPAKQA